jgi:hypothetical protein
MLNTSQPGLKAKPECPPASGETELKNRNFHTIPDILTNQLNVFKNSQRFIYNFKT